VGLTQDAAQRSEGNLALSRDDGGDDSFADSPRKLNMATLLACLDESSRVKASFDFPERQVGLSCANLDLDGAKLGRTGRLRWFEVQFQRFLQVGASFFFGRTLTGDIDLEALGNIPVTFAPNGSGKRSLHDHILAQK